MKPEMQPGRRKFNSNKRSTKKLHQCSSIPDELNFELNLKCSKAEEILIQIKQAQRNFTNAAPFLMNSKIFFEKSRLEQECSLVGIN